MNFATTYITPHLNRFFIFLGDLLELTTQSFRGFISRPRYYARWAEQVHILGAGSLSLSVVIGLIMGMVMTLQFGYGLQKFGGTLYVPAMISLSLVREMAPIFTSLLVAGRIGSGIAAEIGAMNVTQQIDALRALGTSPIRVLVVPRLFAAMTSLPLLAALAAFVGILGGMLVANLEFDMAPGFYMNKVIQTIKIHDILNCCSKCIFFAFVIVILACWKGFKTKEGTRGVGESATWVVVVSSITILISNFFISKIFILLFD
jgi:phospholipid/cholesterol/gamma-HCH transport system permease protein